MTNIFLQLSSNFKFSQDSLERITAAQSNEKVQEMIEQFFQQEHKEIQQYQHFIMELLPVVKTKQGKEKLLGILVYMLTKFQEQAALLILEQVLKMEIETVSKVKFFSHSFKSLSSLKAKKWLILQSVSLLENSSRVSCFSSFIDHLVDVLKPLNLTNDQEIEIYMKLISALEQHPVYKKIRLEYVVRCLKLIKGEKCSSAETSKLIAMIVKNGVVSENVISLLSHKELKKNEMFTLLEILLKGQLQKIKKQEIEKFQKYGLVASEVIRKMKIQAIPRLFSVAKNFGYDQVAHILSIDKNQVESYVIQAIKQGLISAKLDQFQETVAINRVNFRVLRKDERAKLQRDITSVNKRIKELIE